MPRLLPPTPAVRVSFLAAMAEFRAEGRGRLDDESMIGREIRAFGRTWGDLAGFAAYARALRAEADRDTPRPAGFVPCTTWWWVDGDAYLGRVAVRHRLTDRLRDVGGHIGYDVRPTVRRRGHGRAMLAAVLPLARELGIDRALVMCEAGNVGSRRVIEANGGLLADVRDGRYRFWVPTTPRR